MCVRCFPGYFSTFPNSTDFSLTHLTLTSPEATHRVTHCRTTTWAATLRLICSEEQSALPDRRLFDPGNVLTPRPGSFFRGITRSFRVQTGKELSCSCKPIARCFLVLYVPLLSLSVAATKLMKNETEFRKKRKIKFNIWAFLVLFQSIKVFYYILTFWYAWLYLAVSM